VNIEAELIVKGAVQSEDQYIILDTDFLPCGLHCFAPLYGAKGSMLQVAFERIPDSVRPQYLSESFMVHGQLIFVVILLPVPVLSSKSYSLSAKVMASLLERMAT